MYSFARHSTHRKVDDAESSSREILSVQANNHILQNRISVCRDADISEKFIRGVNHLLCKETLAKKPNVTSSESKNTLRTGENVLDKVLDKVRDPNRKRNTIQLVMRT